MKFVRNLLRLIFSMLYIAILAFTILVPFTRNAPLIILFSVLTLLIITFKTTYPEKFDKMDFNSFE